MNIKRNYKKTFCKFCILTSLVLVFTLNSPAYSEEKPLSTIGEPQVKHSSTVSSPFSLGNQNKSNKDATLKPAVTPSIPPGTPSSGTTQNFKPVPAQPKVEELKGTPKAKSLVADPKNKLGLAYPYIQLEKSKELLKKKDIAGAKVIVEPIAKWLTDLTEYHIQLFKKLNNIDTAKNQAQVEKKLALDAALLRDKAFYQLALKYLGENKEKEAVKYFIEVIKSQPKTELGMKSYEILQQIGFTEKVRLVH